MRHPVSSPDRITIHKVTAVSSLAVRTYDNLRSRRSRFVQDSFVTWTSLLNDTLQTWKFKFDDQEEEVHFKKMLKTALLETVGHEELSRLYKVACACCTFPSGYLLTLVAARRNAVCHVGL